MIALLLTLGALLSVLLYPFWFSVALSLLAAIVTPAAPLAAGVFMDALYFSHGAHAFPIYSLIGLCVAVGSLLVRHFVKTSIISSR